LNSLPQNVITVTTILPHIIYRIQRYYRKIFLIAAVITTVTAVLPLFPLPCHPVLWIRHRALVSVDLVTRNQLLCTLKYVVCKRSTAH